MSKPKVATMSINAGGEKVAYKVGQVLDLHGINATVKAVEDLDLIIEYPNGAVREMGKSYLGYYAKYESFPVGAKITRPVDSGEGREFLYFGDCAAVTYEVTIIDRLNQTNHETMRPLDAPIKWHMGGLAVDPTRAPASSYTPKVTDDQPAEVIDADDMVSRKDHEAALKAAVETAVDTSKRNAQLVKDKEELTSQLEDERRQNLTLIMDNVNLQDKVESLERKVSALAIRVPVDMKYTQVNLSQYETKDALLKDLRDGWEVAHETVLENSPTIYRYRLVQYGKLPDPIPMPRHTSAAAPAANGAGQYIMQGNNANIVASQSMPQGLPLTFNRPAQRRGETRRMPELQQSNMRLGAKLIDLQERSDQRHEAARREFAQSAIFSGAE